MTVEFKSFSNIEVDGVPSGNIVDTISNHSARVVEILTAYNTYCDGVQATIDAANARIAFLESIRTYDANKIKSKAFYDRITKDEMNQVALLGLGGNPVAAGLYVKLNEYKDNQWEVLLNDPEVVQGIQYLGSLSVWSPARVTAITAPATRDEAYIAP